jgi:hypothetical protein
MPARACRFWQNNRLLHLPERTVTAQFAASPDTSAKGYMIQDENREMQHMNAESTLVYPIQGITIDAERLRAELAIMEEGLWTIHDRYTPGVTNWAGISLYSVSGDMNDLRCTNRPPARKTPAGEKCPYVCNELLPQFNAQLLRVVFYRLKAGTKLGEHRDYGENRSTTGMVRIHIPVITNDKVVMYVEGKPYYFPAGSAWYFDASSRHRVENLSSEDRIHLLADFKVCEGIEKFLKPITVRDRVRFAYLAIGYYREVATTFLRFMWTKDGRTRIRMKAAQLFGQQN